MLKEVCLTIDLTGGEEIPTKMLKRFGMRGEMEKQVDALFVCIRVKLINSSLISWNRIGNNNSPISSLIHPFWGIHIP